MNAQATPRTRRPHRIRAIVTAVGLAAALLAPAVAKAQLPPIQSGDLALVGGRIFDATGDTVRPNRATVIRAGKLLLVDVERGNVDLSAATVRELDDDQYILPGLFDLHAHYAVDLFGEGRVDEYHINPVIFLANGVTSTFPAGEVDPEGMSAARQRIDAGEQIGPRIHNSGPYFGTARPGWRGPLMTPDSVRAEVRQWAERGVQGFKAKGIAPDQLEALISEAHRYGLTVTGHLDSGFRNSVNPKTAILMGIDRIEHFMGGDAIAATVPAYSSLEALDTSRPEVRDIIDMLMRHGVRYDATLTAYGYFGMREPAVFDRWADEMSFLTPFARSVVDSTLPRRPNEQFERIYHVKRKTIKAFFDAGGGDLITLGTDHPSWGEFLSGFSAHRELHAFVLAGIPPAAALRIGTINGARALGLSDRLGTLEAGKLADLFIVRGNPLDDIRNTRNVELVVKNGEAYDPAMLLESVRGRLGPVGEDGESLWKGRVRYGGG
jgi:imidazolonepropionase-like amidohydrolase